MSNWPALLTTRADVTIPSHTHVTGELVGGFSEINTTTMKVSGVVGFRPYPDWTGDPGTIDAYDYGAFPGLQIVGPYQSGVGNYAYLILQGAATSAETELLCGGDVTPGSDRVFDLGSGTYSWRNLYAYAVYDEGGNLRLDLSAVSLGQDDSAGAGWRTVRMANQNTPAPSVAYMRTYAPQATPVIT